MQYLSILVFGLVLSVDSFTASVGMGAKNLSKSDGLKFALSSGGMEALMTALGHAFGAFIVLKFSQYDHWIAFLLLMGVALHMFKEGWEEKNHHSHSGEELVAKKGNLVKIILLSFATSIDALGVGVSLGAAQKIIWPYLISIGLFAFFATILGLKLGQYAKSKLGFYAHVVGAMVLCGLAIHSLLTI